MHARHQGRAVHTRGTTSKISAARVLSIQSAIPRDKPKLITGYGDDWKAIELGLVAAVTEILKTNIRIYGNAAITEDFELLLKEPDQYPDIAHESYIKRAKTEQPQFLSSTLVRHVFDGVEFNDKDVRSILQQAARQVPRTPDEPSLVVRAVDGEMIVTFAH